MMNMMANRLFVVGVISFAFAAPVLAQNAKPASAIGPAPVNSKQHQILNSALSPETRQTLQAAMDSVGSPAPAK
jgi:hypothetical protein